MISLTNQMDLKEIAKKFVEMEFPPIGKPKLIGN